MSDSEKYPNDRALENVEDGFDDDLDVPTYRKLAEPMNDDVTDDTSDDSDNTATQVFPGVPEKNVASEAEEASKKSAPEPGPESEPDLEPLTDADMAELPETDSAAVESEAKPEPEPEPEPTPRRRYDAYAAAGRTAPQVISPAGRPKEEPEAPEPQDAAATEILHKPNQGESVNPDEDFGQPTEAFSARENEELHPAAGDTFNDSAQQSNAETEFLDRTDFAEPTPAAEAAPTQVAAPAGAVAADGQVDEDTDFYDGDEPEYRRGTTDFGLLLVRLGLGALLLVHGLTTLLGWGNSGGTTALEAQFNQNNFAFGAVMATAIPTTQLIAGTLLVLGLATPLAAALALALSAYLSMFDVATTSGGLSLVGDGAADLQLQLLMTAMALGLQFTGPGRIGIDFGRSWARRPLASSWIFGALAILAAVGLWWLTTNTLPFVR
ncbi:MAG: DoxX family membrane protein [Corynebacterium sp.]|uniref:DoxX family membrane protein n=1 Tax=Corynebacterium sp. TaxID=1720 RepID=UPI0026DCF616|nr:DoxX family membrane protein [Corynebacterium sp.]MDO5029364.1 DoxX family membrane protein [Corynebacterium sp.]